MKYFRYINHYREKIFFIFESQLISFTIFFKYFISNIFFQLFSPSFLYLQSKVGETTTKWAPIAQFFSRTVKAVKRKYDKLQKPDKEQRKTRSTRQNSALAASTAATAAKTPSTAAVDPSQDPRNGGGGDIVDPNNVAGTEAGAHADLMAATMYLPGMDEAALYNTAGMTEEQVAAAAAAMPANVEGMTAEQMAAYMQQMYSGGYYDPNSAAAAAAAATGQPQDLNGPMDPELLQQLAAQQAAYQASAAAEAAAGATASQPRNDRVFWKPEEQQELLRIVQDNGYRQQVLGITDISWDVIAKHLGRGKRSVQRKYDNLKGAIINSDGTLSLPANDGKKWAPEEVAELVRLVDDESYRQEKLGMEKVDWRVLGQHFGRSYESVSYKFSYVKNTGRTGLEGKPKHAKAKHETSYKEMAIWALQQIGGEGTSGQICNMIAQNGVYAPQLDTAIVSGKKTLQRWKHGVRSALNAFPMFEKTSRVLDGEVVWHLEENAVALEAAAAQEKALRQRNKPAGGGARRKSRKGGADGEAGGGLDAGPEEGAQQALAQMAAQQPPVRSTGGRKRKALNEAGETAGMTQAELEAAAQAAAVAQAAAEAAANGTLQGMDPAQMEMLAAQAQMPLLQQIFDPNATISAEQLSLLPPEHLAMLQQQMDAGQLGQQLPVLPLVLPAGGQPGDPNQQQHHHHHHHHGGEGTVGNEHMTAEQHAAAMHAAQAHGHHYDPNTAAAYDPNAHYDPAAHQAALEHQQAYGVAHDGSHDQSTLVAQQQLAEQYAAAGHMMDPSVSAAHQMSVHGVQMGQPVGQGIDMTALAQPVQGYDQYAQYQQYQQYQYQYDPSQQYQTADQQYMAHQQHMAAYGVPQHEIQQQQQQQQQEQQQQQQ